MLRQEVEIVPTFLSNPDDFKVSYKPSKEPQVFIHVSWRAERESGLRTLIQISGRCPGVRFHVYGRVETPSSYPNNMVFHGQVPEERFNREIGEYHAGLRLHEFDGFSEVISKSVLLGQYPISRIRYPHVDSYDTEEQLIQKLNDLKNKEEPNLIAREYYLKKFNEI